MQQNTITVESLIAAIEDHCKTVWGDRAVLSPPDERLYRFAGIGFIEKQLWQQGDVDQNAIRKQKCIRPDSCEA
jgi:hypothetical protein